MSDNIEIIIEPPEDVDQSVEPIPETSVVIEPPLPEVVVQVEEFEQIAVEREIPADISVEIEPPLPDIRVEISDVGLPGRDGEDGEGADYADTLMIAHVHSETPHPVYDDGPSLLLIYENAKV